MAEHITWFDATSFASANMSAQVGDISYFTPITSGAKFNTASKTDLIELGRIKDISLIDTTKLDPDGVEVSGLVNANEAYIDFKGDYFECGHSVDSPCPEDPGVIRLNKSYKEAGIIVGMSIDIGTAYSLNSIGVLTDFTDSSRIYHEQWSSSGSVLFVKSVNPNGDDPNEIEIGQYNLETEAFEYEDGEKAEVLHPTWHRTSGSTHYQSLQYVDGVPRYRLDESFQNRPTRVRFAFDNVVPSYWNHSTFPSTGQPRTSSDFTLSPWHGKTKFWMITTEFTMGNDNAVPGDFQMFGKDNTVNMSSPLGYYAQAKIQNNSKIKSEMFSVAVDAFESSK